MTAGGDGTANHHQSEETRKRLSIANKGKTYSEETRKRIAAAKFKPVLMFNRDGDFVAEFPSVKSAAEYLSVSLPRVSCVLTGRNKTTAGYTFRYKENPDR